MLKDQEKGTRYGKPLAWFFYLLKFARSPRVVSFSFPGVFLLRLIDHLTQEVDLPFGFDNAQAVEVTAFAS